MKTSWWRLSSLSSEDVFKMSSSRRTYSLYSYVFRRRLDQDQYISLGHTFSRRLQDFLQKRLQDIFKTFSRRLQDAFKTSSRRVQDVLPRRLQDIFKTPSRRFQDVFKMFSRRLQDVFKASCQDVFKTSSRHLQNAFETFWRRLQDVLKMSWRRFCKTSWRRLEDARNPNAFKTYHQVIPFLLTSFQDVFKTYSQPFWGVLKRRLSTEVFA